MIKVPNLRSGKTKPRRTARAAQPAVRTHRLFPGFVGLWFAALFGLGSLAASAEALGALVVHLHLPAILPAAAPPLGLTARIVLGFGLAGLGGVIGLLLGGVLYIRAGGVLPQRPIRAAATPAAEPEQQEPSHDQAPRVRSRDAHPDAPPRRPLVVTEDVLPWPTSMVEPAPASEATSTDPFVEMPAAEQSHRFDRANLHADLPPFLAAAMSAVQLERDQEPAPVFVAPAEPVIVPAEPHVVEHIAAEPEPVEAEAPVEPASPPAPASPPPLASMAAAAPKVALDQLPLASLGLVQLIERLALAIAARQARRAAAPPAEPIDPRMPLHRFDPLTMDPAGPLLRAKKARDNTFEVATGDLREDSADHAVLPQLRDPLASIADWADDHAGEALPPRFLGQREAGAATDAPRAGDDVVEPASEGEAIAEHRYSSLADMTLPRPELLTVVAPEDHAPDQDHKSGSDPVVPFPSRHPAGEATTPPTVSGDADRALREALATLRQMSAQR